MQREPEPKIPIDYIELINEINKKKDKGNDEF